MQDAPWRRSYFRAFDAQTDLSIIWEEIISRKGIAAPVVLAATLIFLFPALVFSQPPFYEGKTITVVFGSNPGGTGDMRVRAVASVLRKHIPGNPTIVIDYMPGGGGRKSGNYMYAGARPDGLTIGAMSSSFLPAAVLGQAGVRYDISKFVYLGSRDISLPWAFLTRKKAGLNSLEKLRAISGVRIGAQAVGHTGYFVSRTFAYVIGMREPRFVVGYSGPDIDTALLRGEVDARSNNPVTIVNRNREWIDEGLVDFHAILEIPKGRRVAPHPLFAALPDLEDLTRSDREHRVVALFRALRTAGMPLILPPGTPEGRFKILREAVGKTLRDLEYYREFKNLVGVEPTPLMPEELEKLIKDLPREPELISLLKKLAGPDPLPRR